MKVVRGLCCAVVLAALHLSAHPAAADLPQLFNHQLAPEADNPSPQQQAFRRVTDALRGIKVHGGRFIQEKRVKALSRPLRSEGTFVFEAERGLCWRTEAPFVTTLLVSRDGIAQRGEDGQPEEPFTTNREVLRGFSAIFLGAFAGATDELSGSFIIYFDEAQESWQLGFRPKGGDAARFLSYILLEGRRSDAAGAGSSVTIERLEIQSSKGDTTEIRFKDSRSAETLTETERQCFALFAGEQSSGA